MAVCLCLAGCARYAPVPGGDDTVNEAYFKSPDDFKARVGQLVPGMGESQVMGILGRNRSDMQALTRNEIVTAMFGSNTVQMLDSQQELQQAHNFLQSLYGYRLEYKDIDRRHGFSSPIRITTHEEGFDYVVDLIFQNGVLVEKPAISGGVVNDTSSRTFFDYLNPGTVLDRVPGG